MKNHILSFALVNLIQDDIAEIVANEGIELTVSMIQELHKFLATHTSTPCSVLINKINPYNYSFEALEYFGTYTGINATAILVHNEIAETASLYSTEYIRTKPWNAIVFRDRDLALKWLIEQKSKL